MNRIVLVFSLLLPLAIFGQETLDGMDKNVISESNSKKDSTEYVAPESEIKATKEDPTFTRVETMPEYPGGPAAMFLFIQKNIAYPEPALKAGIQGKVYMKFVVDKSGAVRDTEIIKGIGADCDEEALRVIDLMPNWLPGSQDGKAVSVEYHLPISFNL